jgi:hypothetical protein
VEENPVEDKVEELPVEVAAAESKDSRQIEAVSSSNAEQKAEKPAKSKAETNGVSSAGITWEVAVDAAWSKRDSAKIAGRSAASDAAKILGAPKLGSSQYPTLDKLLAASTLLQLNWRRDGNSILRK